MGQTTTLIVWLGAVLLLTCIILLIRAEFGGPHSFVYKRHPCTCELERENCFSEVIATAKRDGVRVHTDFNEHFKCLKEQQKLDKLTKSIKKHRNK